MRLPRHILALALPAAIAGPIILTAPTAARAEYVRATFSGSILATNPGTPASLGVGTPITFTAVFDTSTLVDHTASVNAATGLGFASVFTASLSDDPAAWLSIKVGPVSFNKFDEVNYGTPGGDCGPTCDLGAGDFPVVTYLNGAFSGIGNMFINSAGYSFDADPIADAFGGFDLGDGNGGYDFYLGKVGPDGDPFATILAVGDYNAANVVITPVPEPSAWALLVAGVALAGATLRRRFARSVEPLRL
ncbi:MAG TPA: PEP-CTERM sorting domain-containing protein [Caulobacteraceae bacterium]|jgi:hypothetical protein